VEAVIRPWRLQHVVKALSDGGIRGLTTYEVRGLGAQGGSRERYAGHEFDEASLVDKVKCEVVVVAGQVGPDDILSSFNTLGTGAAPPHSTGIAMQVNDVVSMIIGAAQTGEYGVFIPCPRMPTAAYST
jgi:nitrogen regulatory protein PII